MSLKSAIHFFLPGISEHYRILRKLRVGSKLDIIKVLSLTTLTVLFEASGIALVLPIISFVRSGNDPQKFAEGSKVGQFIVDGFYTVGLPINLFILCSIAILIIAARQTLNYAYTLHIDHIKLRVGRSLSIRCFESILGSSAENIGRYRAGQFASLIQHECQAAASVVRNYSRIWSLLVTFSIYIVIMLLMAPLATFGAIGLIGGVLLSMGIFIKITRRLAERRIEVRAGFISFLNERFRAWRLIKTANAVAQERDKMTGFADKDRETEFAVIRIGGLLQLILTPVIMFVALYSLYFAIEHLQMEVDKVAMFIVILVRLVPAGQSLNGQRNQLVSYVPSLLLVDRTLDQAAANSELPTGGEELKPLGSCIEFKAVHFTYPGEKEPVLRDIDLTIPAGKITAIIGHSGAGKSTLIDLLLRLYHPTAGCISYDGVPLEKFNLASFRQGIACLSQEAIIFDDTVWNNVRYLRPTATMEEVQDAVRKAYALEFIEKLPLGFETELGENGARLSGGEKQRIALARTFLSGAKVIILDEPTSALDHSSERKIQEAIENFVRENGVTVVIVTHRETTIENTDIVLKFDGGRLVWSGKPVDLPGNTQIIS